MSNLCTHNIYKIMMRKFNMNAKVLLKDEDLLKGLTRRRQNLNSAHVHYVPLSKDPKTECIVSWGYNLFTSISKTDLWTMSRI